ncbi:MAG: hypothetical protein RR436_02765 [Clostridia bacterium]
MINEKQLLTFFTKNKNIIIIMAIIGIALIFLTDIISPKSGDIKTSSSPKINVEKYLKDTESKVKTLVSGIEGAGNCEVMVTISSGSEYVFATEEKTSQNTTYDKGNETERRQDQEGSENKLIIASSSGGQNPIVVKEILPAINGVAVVCDGGDAMIVKSRIIDTLSTLLGIPSNKISVTKKS